MTNPETINIIATIAVAIATAALAITTYLYLKQSNRLIEISDRPQVLLYSLYGNSVIENIGKRTAFNIRFYTKTPDYKEHKNGTAIREQYWYKNGITMIPPQKGHVIHDPNEGSLIKQPPCEIEITYYTEANKKGKKYKETTYIGSYPGGFGLRSQSPLQHSHV